MPLPADTPEDVPITCGGRSAILNIRNQIVTFAGQTMSASRFETVCGKGDAKKWKSSIWLEGPDGGQEQASPVYLYDSFVLATLCFPCTCHNVSRGSCMIWILC